MTSVTLMPEEAVMDTIKATTIVCVKKDGKIAIAGDGQATMGQSVIAKSNCRKVRRIFNGKVVIGFAGSVADAITLYELFEQMLNKDGGDLTRAAVDLAKKWRTDKTLRNLEATMLATDGSKMYQIDGTGNVMEPDRDCMAIGSGGCYALSAAIAYLDSNVDLSAEEIARKSVKIASQICVFTNDNIICEVVESKQE